MAGTATTYVFTPAAHGHLTPYLAALHAACITHDQLIATFLPPLHHEKLLAWWKERIAEAASGRRVILLLLDESQPGAKAKGPELVGVVMLSMPASETGPFRGFVETLLVSARYRRRGGARALMGMLEGEALQKGKTMLMADVEAGSAAEALFKKLGYTEVGKVPRWGRNPAGHVKDGTYFYKDLAPSA